MKQDYYAVEYLMDGDTESEVDYIKASSEQEATDLFISDMDGLGQTLGLDYEIPSVTLAGIETIYVSNIKAYDYNSDREIALNDFSFTMPKQSHTYSEYEEDIVPEMIMDQYGYNATEFDFEVV